MRKLRLAFASFAVSSIVIVAPLLTALACPAIIIQEGATCYLSGEDRRGCYYNCTPNQ